MELAILEPAEMALYYEVLSGDGWTVDMTVDTDTDDDSNYSVFLDINYNDYPGYLSSVNGQVLTTITVDNNASSGTEVAYFKITGTINITTEVKTFRITMDISETYDMIDEEYTAFSGIVTIDGLNYRYEDYIYYMPF